MERPWVKKAFIRCKDMFGFRDRDAEQVIMKLLFNCPQHISKILKKGGPFIREYISRLYDASW